jgi:hypothetical protein
LENRRACCPAFAARFKLTHYLVSRVVTNFTMSGAQKEKTLPNPRCAAPGVTTLPREHTAQQTTTPADPIPLSRDSARRTGCPAACRPPSRNTRPTVSPTTETGATRPAARDAETDAIRPQEVASSRRPSACRRTAGRRIGNAR